MVAGGGGGGGGVTWAIGPLEGLGIPRLGRCCGGHRTAGGRHSFPGTGTGGGRGAADCHQGRTCRTTETGRGQLNAGCRKGGWCELVWGKGLVRSRGSSRGSRGEVTMLGANSCHPTSPAFLDWYILSLPSKIWLLHSGSSRTNGGRMLSHVNSGQAGTEESRRPWGQVGLLLFAPGSDVEVRIWSALEILDTSHPTQQSDAQKVPSSRMSHWPCSASHARQ